MKEDGRERADDGLVKLAQDKVLKQVEVEEVGRKGGGEEEGKKRERCRDRAGRKNQREGGGETRGLGASAGCVRTKPRNERIRMVKVA